MDTHPFHLAVLAAQDRQFETQIRKGLIDRSGKRIFRIGRERFDTQTAGRR